MGLLVLIGLTLVACAVIGLGAAMHALAQARDLDGKLRRQADRLAEVERHLARLQNALTRSEQPPPGAVPPAHSVEVTVEVIGPSEPPASPQVEPTPAPPTEREWTERAPQQPAAGVAVGDFDWESLVGVKLFSWIAGIALALAAVFFLRYSIQNGWLQPPVQMAIGLFVGIALLALCEMKVAGNYRVTANALDASAVAILFATFFASYARWQLVGIVPAFLGLALVTAIAVVLSVRRDSLFIAGLGLIGGFLTPFLLSTGQDNPLGLFGYLLVLNAGLAWVAYYKRWPWLTTASVALTTLYQWAWVYSFMRPDRVPLAASIFLVFPVASALALALGREPAGDSDGRVFATTSDVSAVLPVLFATYLVAAPGYGDRMAFAFGFLLCLCAGLFVLAVARRQQLLHLVGAASAFVVVNVYLDTSYQSGAWPGVLAWIAVFVVLYLAAEWMAAALGRPLAHVGAWATYAAPFQLFALVQLAGMEPATRAPWLLLGVMFTLTCAIAVVEFRFDRPWLRMVAAGMVTLVLLAWLGVHRRPDLAVSLAALWVAIAIVSARLAVAYVPGGKNREVPDAAVWLAAAGAELVAMSGGLVSTATVAVLAAAQLAFLSVLLWIATARRWYALVPVTVAPAALAILFWFANYPPPAPWLDELLLATAIFVVFFAYPLVVERRAALVDEPWLAAVLASGVFFLAARHALVAGGFDAVIGLLPLAQAALMAVLLWRLLRLEAATPRRVGRLALVAGALLAFVTVAVPLQLEKQWITLGWALEAAALAWLYRRIPHRGLLVACLALLVAVFARLMNPGVLEYHERGPAIFNWYLYTYLVCACSMFAAGRFLDATDDVPLPDMPRGSAMAQAGGIGLLFALVNIEIADFYSVGPYLSFNFSATLAQDLTYTLAWAAFGVVLLLSGIVSRSHAARVAALVLLVATVLKGFLHDLARLGGLYRVFSFVGLAVCLALVAVVLQKFVLQRRPGSA